MLPPEERLVGAQLHRYIRDKLYWVLHAPRQTGKTTFLQSWMGEINGGSEAVACYVSLERCQGIGEPERSMPDLCKAIQEYAETAGLDVPRVRTEAVNSMLSDILRDWAKLTAPKGLVVLFDETDVLVEGTLISFLRQLRGGFATRGVGIFPVSVALVGMRDLKDYLVAAKGGEPVNPGSPFNIKSDSAFIGNFSREDLGRLFLQRTEETGQGITAEALGYVWEQSRGQPWIVNSLFMRATMRVLGEESRETVRLEHIREARGQMIAARETHLEALAYRLGDPGIRAILETIITGKFDLSLSSGNPAVEQALDMGLIRYDEEWGYKVANPLYEEIITRHLNSAYYAMLPPPSSWRWEKGDGTLDMDNLLREFVKFWRRHSEVLEGSAGFSEAFPHLLLTAFLQRVTNGGGYVSREAAAGRGRMDLAVEYRGKTDIVEIKVVYPYNTVKAVREEGLEQVKGYRDRVDRGAAAYLLLFDRREQAKGIRWEERLSWEEEGGVTVVSF
jgi:hypothetical protein